jgi:hypothetical protein
MVPQAVSALMRAPRVHRRIAPLCVLLFFALATASPLSAQLTTDEHILDQGWWPTKEANAQDEFVGSQVCASCHAGKAAAQKSTPMAETSVLAHDARPMTEHPKLTFRDGKYQYEIDTSGVRTTFTVSDGQQTQTAELFWAFGNGHLGQSYLWKKDDGTIWEARASYFEPLKGLDFTPTRAHGDPTTLDEAAGRRIQQPELGHCFGCHNTASNIRGKLDPDGMTLGIQCEACHGPGASHVAAAQVASAAGTPEEARGTILNPAQLSPKDAVDFCGACHASFQDIEQQPGGGIATARFQPFRLEQSKCWGKQGDARLTCTTCHDPHQQLVTDDAAYDPKCRACHAVKGEKATATQPGKICPVATSKCASCHMVKVEVPDFHHGFTDHRIRVVRAGEKYPD